MRGHVRKRGTKWAVVVYMGYGDNGKKQYKWFSDFETKKAAQESLTKILNEINTGTYVTPTKITVGEYMERWLADKEMQVRFNTFRKYRWLVSRHIVPFLGHHELTKLSPHHIQQFYTHLMKGEELSGRSVAHLHTVLRAALDRALKWQLVVRNVADAVDPPRAIQHEMSVWNEEQVIRFIETARDDRYFAVYLLALTTGMRKAEICGLQWRDVDLIRGHIAVRQSLLNKDGAYVFEEVKTAKSNRVISVPSQVTDYLRGHRAAQSEGRLYIGPRYQDNDLVNCRDNGQPVSYTMIQKHWLKCIEVAEVPRIRLHDARHTHATMLFKQGVETKLISERLGHARVNVTLDIYTHIDQSMQDAVAKNFGDSLFGGPKKRVK